MNDRSDGVPGGVWEPEVAPRRCWSCLREWPHCDDGTLILWCEEHCRGTRRWEYCPGNVGTE
jgi:hypothetical protein